MVRINIIVSVTTLTILLGLQEILPVKATDPRGPRTHRWPVSSGYQEPAAVVGQISRSARKGAHLTAGNGSPLPLVKRGSNVRRTLRIPPTTSTTGPATAAPTTVTTGITRFSSTVVQLPVQDLSVSSTITATVSSSQSVVPMGTSKPMIANAKP